MPVVELNPGFDVCPPPLTYIKKSHDRDKLNKWGHHGHLPQREPGAPLLLSSLEHTINTLRHRAQSGMHRRTISAKSWAEPGSTEHMGF
jgi:hypothetical protein